MGDFLWLLFSLSISGGVLVLLVALLNRLLRERIPRSFLCCLWLLVLARFLIPVGAGWSVTNRALSALQEPRAQAAPPAGPAAPSEPAGEKQPSAEPAGVYAPAVFERDRTPASPLPGSSVTAAPSVASVLAAVWGLGALTFLSWRLYSYRRLNRLLREGETSAEDWELELYSSLMGEGCAGPALRRSEAVRSPMLSGVLRPVIWLPVDSLDADELSCVLRHELTHWRRRDLYRKWAAALTACVHWFNPAIWYLLRALDRDCELSCDEAVVKDLPLRDRRVYGELLLRCAAGKAPAGALYTSLKTQKQVMRERLTVVMKKNPDGKRSRALFAAAAAGVVLMGTVLGAYAAQGKTELGGDTELVVDLNRNGIPETIDVVLLDDVLGQYLLTVTEGDRVIFTEEAYGAHLGWNALFLYWRDGQAYLLRYTPGMWQGIAAYDYQLFNLAEDSSEYFAQENGVFFDVNFDMSIHGNFDPEALDAFLTEINALLADSVQLMNTDEDLLESFRREGRLYHVPSFLIWEEVGDYSYDENKTILENLTAYKSAMEKIYW